MKINKHTIVYGSIILILIVAGIIFFTSRSGKPVVVNDPVPEEAITIVASGVISSDTVPSSGSLSVVQTASGDVMRFEDFLFDTEDQSVRIFASPDLSTDSAHDLGLLGNKRGNFNVELSEKFDNVMYPYILLWSEDLNVLYAYVEFEN